MTRMDKDSGQPADATDSSRCLSKVKDAITSGSIVFVFLPMMEVCYCSMPGSESLPENV